MLSDEGYGLDSWIIAGMEWAAASGADVGNMSLGSFLPSDGTDPLSQAVNRITAETGTLFVVAAGNNGSMAGWIGSPGAADAALTVGAVYKNDELAEFSSRGPRQGDNAIKPDITAPGVDIVAARAANGQVGEPGDAYVAMSGTSMATPHVAGAAAILAAQHPDWAAEQLKAALMGNAKPRDGLTVFEQGAGRVDVAQATTATVFASTPNLSFGLAQWPHTDDQPITKTLAASWPRCCCRRGRTMWMVTHDLPYALRPRPLSVLIDDGVVVAAGPTRELPADFSCWPRTVGKHIQGFDPIEQPRLPRVRSRPCQTHDTGGVGESVRGTRTAST